MLTAKKIAGERFARGEITKIEYDDIIQTLGTSEPEKIKASSPNSEPASETDEVLSEMKLYATTAFLTIIAFLIFRTFFFEGFYSIVMPLIGRLSGESGIMVEFTLWGADYSKLKSDLWLGYIAPIGILSMIVHPISKSISGED